MSPFVLDAIAVGVSFVAATTDALRGRIPNTVTFPALAAGLLFRACAGKASLLDGIVGCAVGGGPPWLLHRATRGDAIGGGDVKLFAALGALSGAATGIEIEVSTVVVLGVFAIVSLAYRGRLSRVVGNTVRLAVNPALPKRWRVHVAPESLTAMRMGPSIAVAVLTTLFAERIRTWVPWM